jgi:hypothetical protein
MSATSDVTNGLVLTGEGFGYNYGIQPFPTLAPPGTRKMRVAFRAWIEGTWNGSTWVQVVEDYYSTTAWGVSFLPQVPYQVNEGVFASNLSNTNITNPETYAGFVGIMSSYGNGGGNNTRNTILHNKFDVDNLSTVIQTWADDPANSQVCTIGGYYSAGSFLQSVCIMNGISITDGRLNVEDSETYFGSANDVAYYLPVGESYGTEVTIGWEFSANELDQNVFQRWFWDHSSLAENNLISVFDNDDHSLRSISTGVTQWRPDLATYNWPSYFVMRNGHPDTIMRLKAYSVAYYDINGDPLL